MKSALKLQETVDRQELESKVRKMYREVALNPEGEYHFEMGRKLAERLGYPSKVLDRLPAESIDSFAGVGYIFDMAGLEEGERVVDLGSGSGMDVFLASLQVGETGTVTGIDMTEDQLAKAEQLRGRHAIGNVEFRKGYIEDLPVQSESADVVISNGVINLSSDKAAVFSEAARVLKPGGRLAISDIISVRQLPHSISCNATLWAACIGGAMQIEQYYELIDEAGLKVKLVKKNPYSFLSVGAKDASSEYGIMSLSLLAVREHPG
ncbi:MAG: methyltransferase domain-containing protein [Balneolaceae bacterium]|nr:methyltransferase domain-containing protein [Balneolaceae bacterium]